MKHNTNKKPFECAHCGAGVSAPYFYKGDVYGWTCIKFVNPKAKRYKNKIQVSFLEVKWVKFNNDSDKEGLAAVMINGKLDLAKATRVGNNMLNIYGYDISNDLHYATVHTL